MTTETLETSKLPIPCLFAESCDEKDCNKVGADGSGFSYNMGIPDSYSSYHGKKVNRADMNGLIQTTTQSRYFNQLGGYYTFDQQVSDMIGGYPEGAVLYFKDETSGLVREVMSLVSDNNYNFVNDPNLIDNEHWQFVDIIPQTIFRPRIFPDFSRQTNGQLKLGWEVAIEEDSMMILQTGCASDDTADDGQDYYLYVDVKLKGTDQFHTAGLVCYLPGSAEIYSKGMISQPYSEASAIIRGAFTAWNAPFPLQIYLRRGDTVALHSNRESKILAQEMYEYKLVPMKY